MTDPMTLLPVAIDLLTEQVEATSDDGWGAPSPCAGWSALDVLAHVTGTMHKAAASMGGTDYAAVPAEAAGTAGVTEIVGRWEKVAATAADALVSADPDQVIGTPRGDLPLRETLALPTADLAVHAWDIAAAGGRRLELPAELRTHVEGVLATVPPQKLRSEGFFGPEVEAPDDAGPTDQLMAFLGRRRP